MWAADTSWLYAFFDADDAHHEAARREASIPGALLVNPIILAETLDMIRKRGGRDASLAAHENLGRMGMRLMDAPKAAAMHRVVAQHEGVSWRDAAAICTALDEGAGLRTFDKGQAKAFKALA